MSTFTTAASLFSTRAALEAANLFDARGRCVSPFGDVRAILRCPRGTAVDSKDALAQRCKDNGLSCPPGFPCYCGICMANSYVRCKTVASTHVFANPHDPGMAVDVVRTALWRTAQRGATRWKEDAPARVHTRAGAGHHLQSVDKALWKTVQRDASEMDRNL
mmetsp:Transcript_82898/g.222361  ORF Transcript_82898/g.222361 Transcript_82898/m.222361 type:complete len:162 (+) Transcript_82898:977-1462(+)